MSPQFKRFSKENLAIFSQIFLAIVAVVVALIYMKGVLLPFVISLFIYFAVSPTIAKLHVRLKIPRPIIIGLSLLIAFVVTVAFWSIMYVSLKGFVGGADIYQDKVVAAAERMATLIEPLGLAIDNESLRNAVKGLPIFSVIKNISSTFFGFFGNSILVLLFVLFLIADQNTRKKKSSLRGEIESRLQEYVITKVFTSAGTGLLTGIFLYAMGVDLALLFALLTFLLNFIPSVGSIVAVILPLPIAFLNFGVGWQFPLVVIVPGIIQFSIGNILEPKMMGNSLGLHPVSLLMALMMWGSIWGIAGMFLAVPITAVIKIICDRIEYLRPFSYILQGNTEALRSGSK